MSNRPSRMLPDFSTLRSLKEVLKQPGKVAQSIYWARTSDSGFKEPLVTELLVRITGFLRGP